MRYRINEIFYSLQGEGTWTGTPCVFIRFAGCNLKCGFCDTKHEYFKLYSHSDILRELAKYPTQHVVLTGGEPTLQITEILMRILKANHYFIHVETNGTRDNKALKIADWVTCSPKNVYCNNADLVIPCVNEIKVVYDGDADKILRYENIEANGYYLQPCDTGNAEENKRNIQGAVKYCLKHPKWKLSLQIQKILNVR